MKKKVNRKKLSGGGWWRSLTDAQRAEHLLKSEAARLAKLASETKTKTKKGGRKS